MVPLCLNGETLHIQRVATHLGHPVGIDNVNSIAIRNATRDLIWRTNYVMAKLADVRAFMFRTYCTSYYGSPLWQLDSNDVKGMVLISNWCLDLCHFTNHYHIMKIFVLICVICLCKTSRTSLSINRRFVLSKLNEDEYGECSVMNKQYLRSVYENKEKCVANGVLLKELCLLRDGILTTDLSRSDICHLIDFICTGWFYACSVSFCRHYSYFYYKLLYCIPCIKYEINYI